MPYTNYDPEANFQRAKARYEYELKRHAEALESIAKDRAQLKEDIAEIDHRMEANNRSRKISVIDRNTANHQLAELRIEALRRLEALDAAEKAERRYGETELAEQRRTLAAIEFKRAEHAHTTRNDAFILGGGIAFPKTISNDDAKLQIGRAHVERYEGFFQAFKALARKDGVAFEAALNALGLTPEQYKAAFPLVSEQKLNGKVYRTVTQADSYTYTFNDPTRNDTFADGFGGNSGGGSGE